MDNVLERCPVVIETPLAWGQMDAFRHLNNTAYFRFFESARIAYFEKLDLLEFMEATGVGPILAATNCRFKIPLTYPDTVSIGSRVSEIKTIASRWNTTSLVINIRELLLKALADSLFQLHGKQEDLASCRDKTTNRITRRVIGRRRRTNGAHGLMADLGSGLEYQLDSPPDFMT